jgi:hypothetical protein
MADMQGARLTKQSSANTTPGHGWSDLRTPNQTLAAASSKQFMSTPRRTWA